MTRTVFVVGLCLFGAVGAANAATTAQTGTHAQLQLVDMQPVVVRGVGFEPGERVRVILAAGGHSHWKMKVASPAGAFNVRFSASIGACGRYTLQAIGSQGSRVRAFPRRPQLDCVPPDTQGPDRSTT